MVVRRWFRFSLRFLSLVTFAVAVFAAGYRLGFHAGQANVDWIDVGGPGTIQSFDTNCFSFGDEEHDEMGNPFADVGDTETETH